MSARQAEKEPEGQAMFLAIVVGRARERAEERRRRRGRAVCMVGSWRLVGEGRCWLVGWLVREVLVGCVSWLRCWLDVYRG